MTDSLLERLRAYPGVRTSGAFVLAGGSHSTKYIDIKASYGDPLLLEAMTERFEHVASHATVIAGSGVGGIPLATKLSGPGRRLTIVRSERKDHGTQRMIECYYPRPSDRILVVDDVYTSGTSLRAVLSTLEGTGADILGCAVVVARSTPSLSVPVYSLFRGEHFD